MGQTSWDLTLGQVKFLIFLLASQAAEQHCFKSEGKVHVREKSSCWRTLGNQRRRADGDTRSAGKL